MRVAGAVDLSPPAAAAKPFFYGTWSNTTVAAGVATTLAITTVQYAQRGMLLSGGGVKVPLTGIYHIGAMSRSDINGSGPTYSQLGLFVNGGNLGWSITNNGSISGQVVPYSYHQLWLPWTLNAGDVVTVQGYGNPVGCTFYGPESWPGDGLRVMYDSPLGGPV